MRRMKIVCFICLLLTPLSIRGGQGAFSEQVLEQLLTNMADSLTQNLKEWKVPKRKFRIADYGAVGDGKTINTSVIQQTIDLCSRRGGGTVVIDNGDYVTGTLDLKSGVMLCVEKGARLLGSTSLADYPERIEQFASVMRDVHRYRLSLIYAEKADKVGICGEGEIYFRGEKSNFPGPETIGEIEGRPFGIRMIECSHIVLKNITLRNSAAWMQSYIACKDMIFDDIKVVNQANYNNDGLDPDGCRNVIIRNCYISSHDDAMCLKSASGQTNENFLIENSVFHSACNAFKFGTDTQGGFRNILARNLQLGAIPEGEPSLRGWHECSTGITLATVDGGDVENVLVSDVTIDGARCPIFLRIGNRGRRWNSVMERPGRLECIVIRKVKGSGNRRQGSLISGIPGSRIKDVLIKQVRLSMIGGGTMEMAQTDVAEKTGSYPDAQGFSRTGLPAYGFYIRHTENVRLEDVKVTPSSRDERPEIKWGIDNEITTK